MRRCVYCFVFTIIMLSALSVEAKPGASTDTPNVLLISIDSLRADHCGCYGYPRDTTPNIDELARNGVLFENASAASSWTVPSHMSVFTALYPSAHGVETTSRCLGNAVPTLASVLLEAGYATAGFATGPSLNKAMGFNRGFETYDDFSASLMCDTTLLKDKDVEQTGLNHVPTNHVITNLAGTWIRKHSDKPFFLFVHYWDCHFDYIPPSPYDTKFDPAYNGPEDGRDIIRRQGALEKETSPAERQHLVALYDGEIAHTDVHLERLLQCLDELKITDKTLVVLFSDHGEGFWENGKLRHGYGLQEELIHVPLIFRMPGKLPSGLRVKGNVSHVDMMPTVLGLLGLSEPGPVDGLDLSKACLGNAAIPDRPVFSELNKNKLNMRAVRWGDYKMTQEKGGQPGPLMVLRQGREVPAGAGEGIPGLSEELTMALAGVDSHLRTADRSPKQATPDEDTLRLLNSLGYMP